MNYVMSKRRRIIDSIVPKKRCTILSCICFISALVLYFFTTFNFIIVLELLMATIAFLIIHLIIKNMDIRYANILFYVLVLIMIYLIPSLGQTNAGFNIIIKDLDKQIQNNAISNCQTGCKIEGNKIYDKDSNIIYEWHGTAYIYEGYVNVQSNKVKYQLTFENKCVTKEYDKNYIIINNKCDKII